MKTRTYFLAALTCAVLALPVGAQTAQTVFKVKLFDGMEILSASAPVASGSMLLVKNLSDGSLTAVPSELVANVSKARTSGAAFANAFAAKTIKMKAVKTPLPSLRLLTVTASGTGAKSVIVLPDGQKVSGLSTAKMAETLTTAGVPATLAGGKSVTLTQSLGATKAQATLTRSITTARAASSSTMKLLTALQPGQKVFLGPTGATFASRATADVSARGGAAVLASSPLAASIQDQIFVGDLPRMTPRSGLTAGMVAPTTGEVVIGPNGFPVPVTATTGLNGALSIGPNGFPATATTVSSTGLTRSGGSITTALPVTATAATAATSGSINLSVPSRIATSGAAPAAVSPR